MQEVFTDRSCRFHLQTIARRQSVHTYHLHDLLQRSFFCQKAHHLLAAFHPVFSNRSIEPVMHIIKIQGIARQPVDSREMSLVCQSCIQSPEYLYNTKCRLRYRLRSITTRRGYGADNGKRSFSCIFAKRNHTSCSLVKLCQTRTKVCRITFLTGHLLKTS